MTTATALQAGVAAALHRLGPTSEHVADTLTSLGIRGIPSEGDECPVARYLLGNLDADHVVIHVTAELTEILHAVAQFQVPHPDPVKQFVLEFDAGRHNHLDEDTAHA